MRGNLLSETEPFSKAARELAGGPFEVRLQTLAEVIKNQKVAQDLLRRQCAGISPYLAVPVLLQTMADFYYGSDHRGEPKWLGTALKVALAYVWTTVHQPSVVESKALDAIQDIVASAHIVEQLAYLSDIQAVFGEGPVAVTPHGIYALDPQLRQYAKEYSVAFGRRGLLFRTLDHSYKAILGQPSEAMHAIGRVLSGQSPRQQDLFRGSLFAKIPEDAPQAFWVSLWMRLGICYTAQEVRARAVGASMGISIMESFPVLGRYPIDPKLGQRALSESFWQKTWHAKRLLEGPANIGSMFVDRPVVRITGQKDMFVTSGILVWDSINWLVEKSVMRYPGSRETHLPEEVFRSFVSEPFENEVCRTFREQGYQAGPVSVDQVWHTEGRPIRLVHPNGDAFPGEIDVFAFHPQRQEAVVIECKVLQLPFSRNQMRNVLSKINELDSEGFHAKLSRKVSWIQATTASMGYDIKGVEGLIVLDRATPGMMQGQFPVINLDALNHALSAQDLSGEGSIQSAD